MLILQIILEIYNFKSSPTKAYGNDLIQYNINLNTIVIYLIKTYHSL